MPPTELAISCRSACRLYGDGADLDRENPGSPLSSETATTDVACRALTGPPAPPEKTSAGAPKTGNSSASVDRTLRTGPTSVGSVLWKTASSRVRPPSTCSTKTTSASASPYWGRPAEVLSIFTPITGAATTAPPVSGSTGGGAGGGGGSGVGVGVGAGGGVGVTEIEVGEGAT